MTAPREIDELVALATPLCATAGRAAPVSGEALTGGRNNRVVRLALGDGTAVVLKSYYHHRDDPRDRLGAEWEFLTRAWDLGVRCVPEPLACDRKERLGLYGFVAGSRPAATEIGERHVQAAADFVVALNPPGSSPVSLSPASEACFSIDDHLAHVDRRLARLKDLDRSAPYVGEAAAFVAEGLAPAWQTSRSCAVAACRAAGLEPSATFTERELVASPSDFGFHNTLWSEARGLCFLDFEYAGRDDPAKLVADFFTSPDVPVPEEYFDAFAAEICLRLRLRLPEGVRGRMRLLRDVYRVKWACIALNDFLPGDERRRRFALDDGRADRCRVQLRLARSLVDACGAEVGSVRASVGL